MTYNDIAKKYTPPRVIHIECKTFREAASYMFKPIIKSPTITNLTALAVFLHECGHKLLGHTISSNIIHEILETSTFITEDHLSGAKQYFVQEHEAWEFVYAVFEKEGIPITRKIKRFLRRTEFEESWFFTFQSKRLCTLDLTVVEY